MAKTDFLTADMTRRQFMKISGKSLAGLTLSASMLSLFGCSQKQMYRPPMAPENVISIQFFHKCINDICCMVRLRKDSISPFCL